MNPLKIIDLDNLIKNIYQIKKQTNKKIIAVIKSQAYGLGIKQIFSFLKQQNIDFFFVNRLSEIQEIKKQIINEKIIIHESLKITEYQTAYQISKEIRFTISSLNDTYNIIQFINNFKPTIVYIHIFVDTGMHRFGFNEIDDVKKVIQLLMNYKNIIIEGIYTHFSNSNNINEINDFAQYIYLYPFTIIHSASSRQILNDMPIIGNYVRVGMLLYTKSNITVNTMKVITKPLKTFYLKKGDSLGYNSLYKNITCEKELVDIIPLGYYEGDASNLNILGQRCMNHSFIKHIENQNYIEVFPKNISITDDKFYQKFISYQNIKKVYIYKNDPIISKINSQVFSNCQKSWKRSRSN